MCDIIKLAKLSIKTHLTSALASEDAFTKWTS